MKPLGSLLLAIVCFGLVPAALSAGQQSAGIVEAAVVTEVLEWGETVTALRIEYTDEIDAGTIEYSNEHPGRFTYHLVNDRSISHLCVNNSGRKDDVALHGRYVFINLTIGDVDDTSTGIPGRTCNF